MARCLRCRAGNEWIEGEAPKPLIKAIDRVLDKMAEQQRCPFCPADLMRSHKRGCPMVGLLRARQEAA